MRLVAAALTGLATLLAVFAALVAWSIADLINDERCDCPDCTSGRLA